MESAAIAAYDAVLIVTDHDVVYYVALTDATCMVVDTRNACVRAAAALSKMLSA